MMKRLFLPSVILSFVLLIAFVGCSGVLPSDFSIISATTGSGEVTLAWEEASETLAYTVSYGTASGSFTTIASENAKSPYTVTGLTDGTTYYFMVSAVNAGGSKNARSEISAIPGTGGGGNAPGSFAISLAVRGTRSVTLAWGDSSGATSYTVKYGTASGTYGTTVSTNATSPYTVTGLTGTHYFMVQAVNSDGTTNATSEKLGIQTTVVGIEAQHSCYVSVSGILKCWGYNASGQLGKGNTNSLGDGAGEMGSNLAAIQLGTERTVRQLAMGAYYNCAILDNSTVKCWGDNQYGVLGKGDTNHLGDGAGEMGDSLTVVDLGTGRTAVQLSAATFNVCALLDNGSVKCWGYNTNGELGQGHSNHIGDGAGEMGDSLVVTDLGTGRTAVQIASGAYHTCALLDNSTVKCWGWNNRGQLGKGNTNNLGDGAGEMGDSLTAIDLGTGRTAKQITCGSYHTCALLDDDTVKCWGRNQYGELGKGNTSDLGDGANEMGDNLSTIDVGTGRTTKQILGGLNETCVLLDNGTLKCWGRGQYGALGKGNTNNLGDGANEMGDNLTAISLGTSRTPLQVTTGINNCVILDNSAVKCWGYNPQGQLGYGNTTQLGDGAGEMGDNLGAVDLDL